jgi:hypothetical protein
MSAHAARRAKARRFRGNAETEVLARQILADIRASVPPEKLRAMTVGLTLERIPSLALEITARVMGAMSNGRTPLART